MQSGARFVTNLKGFATRVVGLSFLLSLLFFSCFSSLPSPLSNFTTKNLPLLIMPPPLDPFIASHIYIYDLYVNFLLSTLMLLHVLWNDQFVVNLLCISVKFGPPKELSNFTTKNLPLLIKPPPPDPFIASHIYMFYMLIFYSQL